MKRMLTFLVLMGFAAGALGQAVYLKVMPLESKVESRPNENFRIIGSSGSFSKIIEREEAITVTIKNMSPIAFDYTVEWMFLASPIKGSSKVEPFHAGEKKVSLEKNGAATFEARSSKLESTHTHLSFRGGSDGNTFEGKKFAGYVVRAKIDDKILAVEASDFTLKRQFQDPKAKWGVPEEPAEPKKKKGNR